MQESITYCAYFFVFPILTSQSTTFDTLGTMELKQYMGGTSSLPITSPNFSFPEFLEKMNPAQQIK